MSKICNQEGCETAASSHRRCYYHKNEAYIEYMRLGGTGSKRRTFAKYTRHLDGLPVSVMDGLKPKKDAPVCKGNYRANYFKGCGKHLPIYKFGLHKGCYYKWLRSDCDLAKKEISKISGIAKKDVAATKREQKKKDRESIKTVSDWRKDLEAIVNWIVKKLDDEYPCISHPNIARGMRWDAGHYYSVKAHQDLRFHMDNIHKQGSYANTHYGGCPEYLFGLRERYNDDYANNIQYTHLLMWKGVAKHFLTIENIKNEYLPNARKVKREIQKGAEFTREQVNELIGIYTPANLAYLQVFRDAQK